MTGHEKAEGCPKNQEVRTLDYLFTLFDRERFTEALQRARHQIKRDESGNTSHLLRETMNEIEGRLEPCVLSP